MSRGILDFEEETSAQEGLCKSVGGQNSDFRSRRSLSRPISIGLEGKSPWKIDLNVM